MGLLPSPANAMTMIDLSRTIRTSPKLRRAIAMEVRQRVEQALHDRAGGEMRPEVRKECLRELCRHHDEASRVGASLRPLRALVEAIADQTGACWRGLFSRDLSALAGICEEAEFAEIDFLISRAQWELSAIKNHISLARKLS